MTAAAPPNPQPSMDQPVLARRARRRAARGGRSLIAQGEPMLWLTSGGLTISLVMILGLLTLVLYQGLKTFWPQPVYLLTLHDGTTYMGELTRVDHYVPPDDALAGLPADVAADVRSRSRQGDVAERRLYRTGNFEITQTHFYWVSDFQVARVEYPQWAMTVERNEWGRFYGTLAGFSIDGQEAASDPGDAWKLYHDHHEEVRQRWRQRRDLERYVIGRQNNRLETARLNVRQAELDHGKSSPAYQQAVEQHDALRAEVEQTIAAIQQQIHALNAENARYHVLFDTAQGQRRAIELAQIVRCYPANQVTPGDKLMLYLARWNEFLRDDPREANSEGGVYPAIFGTVLMTLIMTLAVVPFGVLAALYLREYAKAGFMISTVRIAINNLAGVPSIVFGVFGLGFFCYIVGANIDQVLFEARLPNPTFGKGGLLWASFTLALLTLPVVIIATEEALAAVPSSMREGSYACGASKWQTIRRIVLPRAMPGIMTGAILAMARGAGEVAPLMLVGAVHLAPELPLDGQFPYLHPQRSFMHLGYHIFHLAFHSQNSEANKPMVFTTTLLLIVVIAALNLTAIWLRARLRRRFVTSQF